MTFWSVARGQIAACVQLTMKYLGCSHGRCAAALGHSGGAQWQNCPWCPPAKLATATGVEVSDSAVLGEFIENFDKPEDLPAMIDGRHESR